MKPITEGQLNDLLKEFRNAAWESGWYAGAMEKNGARMTNEQLKEYAGIMQESINKRTELHDQILTAVYRYGK